MDESVKPQRLVTLDALRGFAVMGILAMNIVGFAMPSWAYFSPIAYHDSAADRLSWAVSFVLIDGKMRGLFSLLFGASMMLIASTAEAKGQSAARVHYTRIGWLALFGLAHYFLLWFGDILFLYACVGAIAFLMHYWQPARLIKWALIFYAAGFLFWTAQFGGMQLLQWAALQPGAAPDMVASYQEMLASPDMDFSPVQELAVHRGGWTGIVSEKLALWWHPLDVVFQNITETLPLMMLGMAFMKTGFLSGERPDADYRRMIRGLFWPGLLLSLALLTWAWSSGFDPVAMVAIFLGWSLIPRLMLTIAYAALLVLIIRRLAGHALLDRIAAAGRAAFSNYLGTTIVMTTLFYGYGLGLYGHVGRASLWLFVIGAWAVMLLWSKPWLERFQYGPLEWLWRSLARGQLQPMRR
jgi:uncharacterized protein